MQFSSLKNTFAAGLCPGPHWGSLITILPRTLSVDYKEKEGREGKGIGEIGEERGGKREKGRGGEPLAKDWLRASTVDRASTVL